MSPDLLRLLYEFEQPCLQANDWSSLRVSVSDLIARAVSELGMAPADVEADLRRGRQAGDVLFLPDWAADLDLLREGEEIESAMWEPAGERIAEPQWRPRRVFLPAKLGGWAVRSRTAEVVRLLGVNRERFGLEPATAHVGYEFQRRSMPARSQPIAEVVSRLLRLIGEGGMSGARAETLRLAIEVVGEALGHPAVSGFQERTWATVLAGLFGRPRAADAATITAGVSSGKTFAFLLPLLSLLVYRALTGQGRRCRALVLYPRTSLAIDQHHVAEKFVTGVNAVLARRGLAARLTERVALDAGQRIRGSLGVKGSLQQAIVAVASQGVELVLTTPESLKNRLLDGRAVPAWLSSVELVVVDEVHTMEGLAGCHGLYQLRRSRELMRLLRGDPRFEPFWVGASATMAEPVCHAAKVFSLPEGRVAHVRPEGGELVEFAVFHHVFVHTRAGKPGLSAVTNGLSCLVHNRNDGTAHSHYRNPADPLPEPIPASEIRKTIAFVDALSTIGRLDFTTRDNEGCHRAQDSRLPYYGWFFRPAARLRASAEEVKRIDKQVGRRGAMEQVRSWCASCWNGRPAEIDRACFDADEFEHLCTSPRMTERMRRETAIPGFGAVLGDLPERVRNLDGCPFLREGLCWHFSQDSGSRRALPVLGDLEVYVDQLRTVQYTSQTTDAEQANSPSGDVNDFFRRPARDLWFAPRRQLSEAPEPIGVMLASPKIEVGVDFDLVRDGVTYKALRSAASFQQKVGRVGREPGSDSLIATFLAQRSADSHFAHHPDRLLDPSHLDPIALKDDNADAIRTHLFTAALEYLAAHPGLPGNGQLIDVVAPLPANDKAPWDAKVRGCLEHLRANREPIVAHLLRATGRPEADRPMAREAAGVLENWLDLFLADLSGVYLQGGTPARWFKENPADGPDLDPAFRQFLAAREAFDARARELPEGLAEPIGGLVSRLREAGRQGDAAALAESAGAITAGVGPAMVAGLPPQHAGTLLHLSHEGQRLAEQFSHLGLAASLSRALEAYELVRAFFQENGLARSGRMTEQYYLHNLLATLSPFRRSYPYGLLRTHFQHIQHRQVRLWLPFRAGEGAGRCENETLSIALAELLPGMWNYRYGGRPRKSLCGEIGQAASDPDRPGGPELYINLSRTETVSRTRFEPLGAPLFGDDLPADLPTLPDTPVSILRPIELTLEPCSHQPQVRAASGLAADGDESPRAGADDGPDNEDDEDGGRFDLIRCPTLPRGFAAVWYRIPNPPAGRPVRWPEAPISYPALGRALFDAIEFTDRLTVTAYTYAVDRVYGNAVPGPRLYYRHGPQAASPAVIGDTLMRTDALRFRLNDRIAGDVLDQVLAAPGPVRGEVVLRAVRTFLSRAGGAGPFQSDLIRRAVAMDWLDRGGDLDGFGVLQAREALGRLDPARYATVAARLVEAKFLGDSSEVYGRARQRQSQWLEEAGDALARAQGRAGEFDPAFVRRVARDLLVHTLAVAGHEAVCRLVGAGKDEVGYFAHAGRGEFYVFDSVEGGNGFAETAARFFHLPPQGRGAATDAGHALPSQDGFDLLAESVAACPAQAALRVVFEAARRRAEVGDAPPESGPLRPRVDREYRPVTGARPILTALLGHAAAGRVLGRFEDLLWLQIVPEWFALHAPGTSRGFSDFQTRVHGCVTGCYECLDNGDGSVYGPIHAREHVSRGLLNELCRRARLREPGGFATVPPGQDAPAGAVSVPDPALASGDLLVLEACRWRAAFPGLATIRDDHPID